MTIKERLYAIALEKGLRETTVASYQRLLNQMGLLDAQDPSLEEITNALWTIDNPNSRRAATIAIRSVTGLKIKIPKGVPRRYVLPDENTLRLALMTSPHETRLLTMMYAGLRIGEACAINRNDIDGDRLSVTKQVIEIFRTGQPTTRRIGPVKTTEGTVIVPVWLGERLGTLEGTVYPSSVRESLRRAGRKVGVNLNPHELRHFYATESIKRGMPFALVSRQLRHSDVSVTLRTYQQFNDADVHKAWG